MRRGFTLIELLVVISIIGLLSSITIASVQAARERGKIAHAIRQSDEIKKAVAVFHASTGELPQNCALGFFPLCNTANDPFINSLGVNGWAGPYISTGISQLYHAWTGRFGYGKFDIDANGIAETSVMVFDDDRTAIEDNQGVVPQSSIEAIDDILDDGNLNTGNVRGNGADVYNSLNQLLLHTATGEFVIMFQL